MRGRGPLGDLEVPGFWGSGDASSQSKGPFSLCVCSMHVFSPHTCPSSTIDFVYCVQDLSATTSPAGDFIPTL